MNREQPHPVNGNTELECLNDKPPKDQQRHDNWDRKVEGLLSLLGYIVGLGNLWRFPYLCMKNGGGAFLIPFVFCIIFCAFPLFFLELALGQFTAKSTIHCWEVCPLFKGVGFGMVLINGLCCLYYVMVVTWSLYFIGNSFLSPLPWSTCTNDWNTDSCFTDVTEVNNVTMTTNESGGNMALNTTFIIGFGGNETNSSSILTISSRSVISSEEEFWQYNVLNISEGIDVLGDVNVKTLLCLMGAWLLVFFCLMKGVKSIGKAVYITATMPYVLLLVLMVRAATLPGAKDGVLYYITPSFSQITNFQVWSEAAVQVFFSTCVSWGPLITMASHNKFRNNCLRDSVFLVIAGELTSVLVGFVVFSILGYMAHMSKLPIEDVVKSGPGLVFIAYPEAVSTLPLPNLWAILFFLMVLMLGLDTQFGTVEPVIAIFTESFVFIRRNRVKFTAFVVIVCFLFGLPFCFQGGVYLFQLMDWYAGAGVPLFGLIECLVFGWIYGAENFSRDIESMLGRPVPVVIRILWCCITPVLLMALLFIILTNYQLPTYGNYAYPRVANVFGVITAIIPVLPIPIVAILEIRKAKGNSLMEKFQSSIKPSEKWGPVDHYTRTIYERRNHNVHRSFLKTVKRNILGK